VSNELPFIFSILAGPLMALYGWWSFFRTEKAIHVQYDRRLGYGWNLLLAKFQGIAFLIRKRSGHLAGA
jgi:hypothetical protein